MINNKTNKENKMKNLMNIHTGSIDTAENWRDEGYTPDNSDLVEVENIKGEWIEVQ